MTSSRGAATSWTSCCNTRCGRGRGGESSRASFARSKKPRRRRPRAAAVAAPPPPRRARATTRSRSSRRSPRKSSAASRTAPAARPRTPRASRRGIAARGASAAIPSAATATATTRRPPRRIPRSRSCARTPRRRCGSPSSTCGGRGTRDGSAAAARSHRAATVFPWTRRRTETSRRRWRTSAPTRRETRSFSGGGDAGSRPRARATIWTRGWTRRGRPS